MCTPPRTSQNNLGVIRVPEDEFTFYVPSNVYCVQDLVWKIRKKCKRINEVLHAAGWNQVLGALLLDVNGMIDGGVGTVNYAANIPPIIPNDPITAALMPASLISCLLN